MERYLAKGMNQEGTSKTGRNFRCEDLMRNKDGSVVKRAPSRFRNAIAKYIVRRTQGCSVCGTCIRVCPFGVHEYAGKKLARPREHLCIGPSCARCIKECPNGALSLVSNPLYETLGDCRWTNDLITSTWFEAETGEVPPNHMEYRVGDSGGGFDRLRFRFPKEESGKYRTDGEVSTSIQLNKRRDGRPEISIDIPMYGGGMSFGSISLPIMLGRAKAAKVWNTFTCTGEGGYPEELSPYDDHVITQVATGLFGVREQTIQRVRVVEFKYAQGAKPGLGGHLLGDKVTQDVASMREAVTGSSLFSPFPFHSVYSVEDHKKHVDWIKEINPRALIAVKVSTPTDIDMVAVGSYYAGAHIIHLDGSYGGTGAAPDIAKKNIAMPIEYAIPKVHKFLIEEGIREEMTLIASGGIRTAYDAAKAIALGADGVVLGTTELVALECVRCGNCESGRGCARGIATTDRELSQLVDVEWAAQRLINLYSAWHTQFVDILNRLGMKSIQELVGRTDCLIHLDYVENRIEVDRGEG
ncbi:MAG: glutamate synthase-related protein [bacterium]|nr:glutamate synthase-related protein [bacterium]